MERKTCGGRNVGQRRGNAPVVERKVRSRASGGEQVIEQLDPATQSTSESRGKRMKTYKALSIVAIAVVSFQLQFARWSTTTGSSLNVTKNALRSELQCPGSSFFIESM
jgi:hypothetical protein